MAAPVLPYPDMDFTPLDVLTAEEMNQMVANDEYLRTYAAGLANGTNLSDGIIQTRHLDAEGIRDKYFPVGTIIPTTNPANPSTYIGGTWERYGKGQVLVGLNEDDNDFGTVGKSGGAKTVTLTVDQIPSHHHTIVPKASFSGGRAEGHTTDWQKSDTTSQNTSDTGGGQPHDNMPPYISVYFWHRVA